MFNREQLRQIRNMSAAQLTQYILENDGLIPQAFERGEKIAQLVIVPIPDVELVVVDKLGEHARGDSGFGSTGRF